MNRFPSPAVLDSLIQQRAIQAIGFTPTDALHVLGEYTEWDVETAQIGAKKTFAFYSNGSSCFLQKNKAADCKKIWFTA